VGSFASVPGQVSSPAVLGVAQPAVVSQPAVSGVAQPAVVSQPAISGVAQPAQSGGAQPLANDMPSGKSSAQNAPQTPGKKPNLYAEVMKASKNLAQTGPGPIPIEAMNYFNKFGGAGNISPMTSMGNGVPVAQQAPAVQPQQVPAVSQPMAPNVQQYDQQQQQRQQQQELRRQQLQQQQQQQQQRQQQRQQQQQYAQQQVANQFQQDQRQNNPYYNQMYRQPRPYVSRNGNYHPPAPRPYPLHQDKLDKSTGMYVITRPCAFHETRV
jgi:hypothetical protein